MRREYRFDYRKSRPNRFASSNEGWDSCCCVRSGRCLWLRNESRRLLASFCRKLEIIFQMHARIESAGVVIRNIREEMARNLLDIERQNQMYREQRTR
jgi:hypothetical protein